MQLPPPLSAVAGVLLCVAPASLHSHLTLLHAHKQCMACMHVHVPLVPQLPAQRYEARGASVFHSRDIMRSVPCTPAHHHATGRKASNACLASALVGSVASFMWSPTNPSPQHWRTRSLVTAIERCRAVSARSEHNARLHALPPQTCGRDVCPTQLPQCAHPQATKTSRPELQPTSTKAIGLTALLTALPPPSRAHLLALRRPCGSSAAAKAEEGGGAGARRRAARREHKLAEGRRR